MPGPGEYRPDPSEGITRIEDLPKPKICCQSRNYRRRPCPRCGRALSRSAGATHPPRLGQSPDWSAPRTDCDLFPALLHPLSQVFQCRHDGLAAPGSHYTSRVVDTAVRLVIEDGLPFRAASWSLWRDHRVFVPYATIQNWVEDGGKRHSGESPPITSTGHSPTSRAISPLTSCMTARSVSCRSLITAPSNGCPTASWTATRPKSTSRHSSAASARPWRHAG